MIGTAWPLQAGHAGDQRPRRQGDGQPEAGRDSSWCASRATTRDIPVTGKRVHPGYDAFNEFVDEAIATSQGLPVADRGAAMPSAYDVAILDVDPAADLGKFLVVPTIPTALTAGTPLAFAGYPVEGTGAQKLAQLSPNPVLQFGRVTALSDYFLFSADKPQRAAHRKQPAGHRRRQRQPDRRRQRQGGGDPQRRHGRHPRRRRARPSAVMLNYAQRADLIRGVLDPASFDLEAAKAEWQKALALFDSHENTVVADARSDAGAEDRRAGRRRRSSRMLAEDQRGGDRSARPAIASTRSRSRPATAYTFVAYGDYDGTLNLMLLRDGKGVTAAYGSSWFSTPDLHGRARRDADAAGCSARPSTRSNTTSSR